MPKICTQATSVLFCSVGEFSMKKLLVLIFVFILGINASYSNNLKFSGNKYKLLFSTKNPDFGGYLNEYYKPGETYNLWSEMIGIHHFPNVYSPIEQVRSFKDFLAVSHIPCNISFDDKKNAAMIDFIMISGQKAPIVMEFNVFKYEKSETGSVAMQYAKRYVVTTAMQADQVKRECEKDRNTILKKMKNFKIPKLVAEEVDLCKINVESETEELNSKDNKSAENIPNNENSDSHTEKDVADISSSNKLNEEKIEPNDNKQFIDETKKTTETGNEIENNDTSETEKTVPEVSTVNSISADENTTEENISKEKDVAANTEPVKNIDKNSANKLDETQTSVDDTLLKNKTRLKSKEDKFQQKIAAKQNKIQLKEQKFQQKIAKKQEKFESALEKKQKAVNIKEQKFKEKIAKREAKIQEKEQKRNDKLTAKQNAREEKIKAKDLKKQQITEKKQQELQAKLKQKEDRITEKNIKKANNKAKKQDSYTIVNDKSDFYAKPVNHKKYKPTKEEKDRANRAKKGIS